MSKIETLTPEQIAKFPAYVAEWKGYGLSTEPADRPRAEAAIYGTYEQAGLKRPRIVWTQSPLGNALAFEVMRKGVRASVWASVRASVADSVWDSVGDSVWASVRDSVWASVRDSVADSVWASVRASVRDSVWASVRDSVWASVRDSVWASVYGQHDAHWLAFYAFFNRECGLASQTDKLRFLCDLCQSAGWALPYEHVCFVSERHDICRLDDEGRIHGETGPAIRYPDGFAVYAWHGTRIPSEWIENRKSLNPTTALTWENIEQRRCAIEIVGWDAILAGLDAKTIDADADPQIGTLVSVKLPDLVERQKFIRVECGTGRRFAICVPPEIKTAMEGQAWMQGLALSDFARPEIRT